MAGITEQGLVVKTFNEIYESFVSKIKAEYGESFIVDTNTPEGLFSGILSDELEDVWQAVQDSYDASYRNSATGNSLAYCAERVGVTPLGREKTTALLHVTGSVGAIIPATSVISVTGTQSRFKTIESLTLHSTEFNAVVISVSSVVASTNYSVTVNNTTVTITSSLSPTEESIVSALGTQLESQLTGVVISYPTLDTIKIELIDPLSEYTLLVGARLSVDSITNIVSVEAEEFGPIEAPANTLTSLLVPVVGVTGVTNKVAGTLGREKETDTELRVRTAQSVSIIGASTNPAITANIANLDGVINAFIIENDTFEVDADGRPPKSFETVVEGGDEEEIAENIFRYKPTGIQPIGSITRIITDDLGQSRTVRFSRPVNKYIHVIVQYTRTSEEPFPSSGQTAIKEAIVTFGTNLGIGQDVFVQRFYKPIFDAVTGIAYMSITMAVSDDGITAGVYTNTSIPMDLKDTSVFSIDRITVTEV